MLYLRLRLLYRLLLHGCCAVVERVARLSDLLLLHRWRYLLLYRRLYLLLPPTVTQL
ncbi:hypothetical protein D3C76_1548860 [compost metagenome]